MMEKCAWWACLGELSRDYQKREVTYLSTELGVVLDEQYSQKDHVVLPVGYVQAVHVAIHEGRGVAEVQ